MAPFNKNPFQKTRICPHITNQDPQSPCLSLQLRFASVCSVLEDACGVFGQGETIDTLRRGMENVVAEYRSEDVWSSSSVDDVVLSSAVHPNLLFGYRLLAFLFALVVSLIHLKIKGIRPLKFYTKWCFFISKRIFVTVPSGTSMP